MFIRTMTIGVAATAALLLAGCGSDSASPDTDPPPSDTESSKEEVAEGDFREGPVPDSDPNEAWKSEVDLPEKPGSSASIAEQIEHELLTTSIEFTHELDDKATVKCPDETSGDITCDMTYFGQDLSWKVSISGSEMFATYEYESEHRVLSREFVENVLRFKAETENVQCPVEEYSLVKPKGGDPVTCQSDKDGTVESWELSVSAYGRVSYYPK